MDYFTSDTHFGHANIIKYCSRPFTDTHHMNSEMTARWNARVKPEDTVYFLGDFAMGQKSQIPQYLDRLAGRIIVILGNHDREKIFRNYGLQVEHEMHLPIGVDSYLYLKHEPHFIEHPDPKMLFFLCGHVHDNWKRKEYTNGQKIINVGVDQWDFTPRTLYELMGDGT